MVIKAQRLLTYRQMKTYSPDVNLFVNIIEILML